MTHRLLYALSALALLGAALLGVMLLGAALPAMAQDRAEVAPSQIIGNRELPKVLVIVPWKKPLPDALNGRPPASVLDEVLAPVDRDVFRRQLRYSAEAVPARTAPAPVATKP